MRIAFGGLRAPAPGTGHWLTVPHLLPHGFAFDWKFVPPFSLHLPRVDARGHRGHHRDFQLSGLRTTAVAQHWRRVSGGVLADGINSTVTGLFGGFPSATYAQNNGVIQITGVASRRVGYVMAVILALLGLFPAVGRWITVLPPAVLGGLAMLMFGLVAVAGIRLLITAGLGQREGVIVALSLGMGIGLPTQPAILAGLPSWLHALLESGISAGGLTALAADAVLARAKQ